MSIAIKLYDLPDFGFMGCGISRFLNTFPSKSKQMSEQMFNIAPQFHVKLALPLCLRGLETLCYAFYLFPLRHCPFALNHCIAFSGGSLPYSRRTWAKMAKRQLSRLLSPRLRQYGGASRVCRRILWRKSRNSVAVPVFPAVRFGDNSANRAHPQAI
jgi:hypothetical protein